MALYRTGGTPESAGARKPSVRRHRWTPVRIGAVASAVAAVGAFVVGALSATALAAETPDGATQAAVTPVPVAPPTVEFVDECDGTVSVEIVNPAGNGNIAVSYGTPGSMLSVFTSQTPAAPDVVDNPVTIGTWIQASAAGQVHGIRWYFPAVLPSSPPIGVLYSATGAELARATFSSPVAGAWNEVQFASPVGVGAGDYVVAAVYTSDHYVATNSLFASSGLTNGVLSAPATGDAPAIGNGVYNYSGSDAAFPNSTFEATGYFVDVLFTEGGVVEDDGVPQVVSVPAGAGQISVTGAGLNLTHTWSQPQRCPTATVTFADNCDGTVTVVVTNPAHNEDITVSWTGGSETVTDDGQLHTIGVPATGGQITVTGAGLDSTHTWSAAGTSGCTCTELDNCPPAPTTQFADHCDGTVTVTVTNPQGNEDITVSWTGGSKTVPDDGDAHAIEVPATGGSITLTGAGLNLTHTWEKPEDCPTATPTTTPPTPTTPATSTSTMATLPVTGGSLTGLLWAGGGLLLSGIAILLFVSDGRSRRERPTQA